MAAQSPTTLQTTRAKAWTNQALNRVVRDIDYPFLRRQTSFVTVAGQRLYVPEPEAMEILNIRIPSENRYLNKISNQKIDRLRPEYITDTNTALPSNWYYEDSIGVATAIASAGAVVYAASDATETAATTITIEGYSGSEIQREVLTLAAAATPTATGTKSFTEILSVSKSGATVGIVTLKQTNSSGTTLATLGPYRRTRRYIRIGLENIPGQVYTCYMRFIPWMADLVNDSDVPRIPEPDNNAILNAAMLIAAEYNSDADLLASRERKYADAIAKIRERVKDGGDEVPRFRFDSGMDTGLGWTFEDFMRSVYFG